MCDRGLYIIPARKGDIKKYYGNTGQCVQVFRGHTEQVLCMCITSDFKYLVSGSSDKKLIVWNVDTAEKLLMLHADECFVRCVAISPDDSKIVSGGDDPSVKVWDLLTGRLEMTLNGHESGVNAIAISPSGEKITSASARKLLIWSLLGTDAGRCLFVWNGHDSTVFSVVFTRDSQCVISGSFDQSIRVWNVNDGVNLCNIDVEASVDILLVTSSGDKLVGAYSDTYVSVYDITDPRDPKFIRKMGGRTSCASALAISLDGQYVVGVTYHSSMFKWRMDNGPMLDMFSVDSARVNCVVLVPEALFSNSDLDLMFSGRIVDNILGSIAYKINAETRVETRNDVVMLFEKEIMVSRINASNVDSASLWKSWIIAFKNQLDLPQTQRAKTGNQMMNRYKADWLQTMNILEQGRVNFLPKNAAHLIKYYLCK